jgi:hypothetical protein
MNVSQTSSHEIDRAARVGPTNVTNVTNVAK